MMIHFRALGEVAASVDDERIAIGGARQRRLLAMLLIHRNSVVSAGRLAEAVFAGEPTDAAATTLRSYIARIRRAIEGHDERVRIVTQPPGYCLHLPEELFDVALFEAAVSEAGRSLSRGEPGTAAVAARQAIERWTGNPYPEFDDEVWVQPEAQRLHELRLVAADRCFAADLECGRAADAVSDIERMVSDHPTREGFRAQLMLALYRSGRQADALRVYQEYRTCLAEELGLEPSPALAVLEGQILAHDPSLANVDCGRTLHGYRLSDRLGTGRDGALYSARIPGVDREFVLRSYRTEVADEPHFVRTFESDAHRLASLRHPAIVPLHDYWRGPHEAYLATPRFRGGTLADRLRSGRLHDQHLAALVARVGGALVAASAAGITHGRIDTSNVVFDDEGLAYLTDFSLGAGERSSLRGDVDAFAALVGCSTASEPVRLRLDRAAADASTTMAELVADLLDLLEAPHTSATNPYKGLEVFDEVDAVDFFGRDQLVDEVVKRLHDEGVYSRLVLLVGGSGTGKSSVVRAGLIPRLRAGAVPGSERWLITACTPGAAPFQRLADALTRLSVVTPATNEELDRTGAIALAVQRVAGDAEVVVFVDQLEELFTMAEPATQQRFLDELSAAVTAPDSRLRVVATLRADFFDRPLGVPSIGQLVNGATVTIPAMTAAGLGAAIVEPARRVGRNIEGPLVAELVSAVVHDAAALPALQFTLYELAERCDVTLTLSAYHELGGVSGAVAARSEQLYRSASEDERPLIRWLFERMVMLSDGEATRRRVPITDFTAGESYAVTDAVIERWAAARLLTLDRDVRTHVPTVEIAHEALIREWPRLQRWINEDRDALAKLARVHDAAHAWAAAERDAGSLLRGIPLQAALELIERNPLGLSPIEREFVEASRVDADAGAAEQAAQLQRERRANRRLRWQLAALGALLAIALVVGLFAIDQRRTADRARRFATARELAAAAESNLDVDPERSTALALEAVDVTRSAGEAPLPEAITALHAAAVESRIVQRIDDLGGTVAWSPTGEYLVSEGAEDSGIVDLRDPESGESVRTWRGDEIDINDVAFSSDGSMLATTGDDGSLRVWDPDTGALLFEYRSAGGGSVWGPTFSGDGTTVAASWLDEGKLRAFDLASGDIAGENDAGDVRATSLNDDGSRIALGTPDGVFVADVVTGAVVFTLEAPGAGPVWFARFSPDGRYVAATAEDGVVRLWDASTGERRYAMGEKGSSGTALAWSADSRLLAVGSAEGTTRVWEILDDEARVIATVTAQDTLNGVQGVAFSPDATRLATGDTAIASILVWDITPLGGAEWANASARRYPSTPLAVIDDDQVVAAFSEGGVATYSMDDGTARQITATPDDDNIRIAVDPAGVVLATAEGAPGAPVQVWDVASGELRASFVPPDFDEWVTGLSWSRDGTHLAISGGDGDSSSIVVVDQSGSVLARFREEPDVYLRSSSFSPDGTLLAIPRRPLRQATPDQQGLWLWDWQAEAMIGRIDTPSLAVDWDPSGERVVTIAELESRGEIWDTSTLDRITSFTGASLFNDVRFGPDGSEVATAGADGDVNLWSAADGIPLATLRGHRAPAFSLAFAHDGKRLASIDGDGIIRIWALDIDQLIGLAKSKLTRNLTDFECRQYLHRNSC